MRYLTPKELILKENISISAGHFKTYKVSIPNTLGEFMLFGNSFRIFANTGTWQLFVKLGPIDGDIDLSKFNPISNFSNKSPYMTNNPTMFPTINYPQSNRYIYITGYAETQITDKYLYIGTPYNRGPDLPSGIEFLGDVTSQVIGAGVAEQGTNIGICPQDTELPYANILDTNIYNIFGGNDA
jgi:hypothetical protein